ncbi:MAG: SDR family NAD(P)-dependent oxidoreductase [Lentisphaerae bacterium]|nr:SDR family NAD(P)-dependent oxidoreductase [Lentisphaerota bacterium]
MGASESVLPVYAFQSKVPARLAASALRVSAKAAATAIADAVRRHTARAGRPPAVVAIAGLGAFVLDRRPAPNARPRLPNVVALVTGAAQGLGRGIAEELAGEGARIVVGDLNAAAGETTAADLNRRFGAGTAHFVTLNVTNLVSAQAACAEAVRRFGGLDLLVSNAGVLKAGGIEDLDEAAFDLVTAVNYKGFFLCVKAAVPILRAQHRCQPRHTMDIIQINSKSGLEGSNRNFAYAGGKFGGLGLVQSFALELVSDHIKVNAICPGNFFDGPLWSDPKQGLFVQYLKAGKVKGAKTVADVRAFYTSKVPMNRGVTPLDIARAVFYLREQAYETGQAVPVTGGQVMLK